MSVSHNPVSNGAGSNITTTTVELATLGTVDIPERLLDANPKDKLPVGGTLVAGVSDGSGKGSGNDTVKLPKGYFSHTPFERTVQAEFRKSAFPALILGLALLFFSQMILDMYLSVCFTGGLRQGDMRAGREKGQADGRRWRVWRRRASWAEGRGQCAQAARVKGIFAAVRILYVLVVVVVCVSVAGAKVDMGKAAP